MKIQVDQLRELLEYDCETGLLHWKQRHESLFGSKAAAKSWNSRWAGRPALTAFCNNKEYRHGHIFGKKHKAHIVGWALHYGYWPDGEIDHINGDASDNRIANLRIVSRQENCKNVGISARNTSGKMGVSWSKARKKWQSFITINGRIRSLGRYECFAAASIARDLAEIRLGYHANHGRRHAHAARIGDK